MGQRREGRSSGLRSNALYWLDRGTQPGTGKVMRMRKLDGPGYPDAGGDGGIVDASDENTDGPD